MADIQKTIEIIFGATDQTGSVLTSVASGVDTFVDKVSGVTGPLASLNDFAFKTEAAIIAMGAAFLAVSVNEAAKFQSGILEIGTLFSATKDQADAFGKQIMEFASNSTQSIDEIVLATNKAIGAGVAQADALKLVAEAEKLAVAGGASLSDTTVALVSTMNAYGASADQAQKFSDIFFQTVKIGQANLSELAAAFPQVTGVAVAAGIPFETLAAAVGALSATGVPASQAVTGLKAAISNILQPSKEASELAAQLGIQFDASALKSKGFEAILQQVSTATGGSAEKMSTLFGSVEAFNAVSLLAKDNGSKFAAALDLMKSSAGVTQAAFELMSSSGALAFQNLINNLKLDLIGAGLPILEIFGGSIKALADVFKGVKLALDAGAFQPVYDALSTAAAGIDKYLQGVAAALPEALKNVNFGNLIASFGELGKAVAGLFGGLDLTKPEDLAKAIQLIVDGAAKLTKMVAGSVESFGPLISAFLTLNEKVDASNSKLPEWLGNLTGISKQFEILKPLLEFAANGVILAAGGFTLLSGSVKAVGVVLEGGVLFNLGKLIGYLGQAGLVAAAGAAGYAVGGVLAGGIDKFLSLITGKETTLGGFIYDITHSGEAAEGMAGKVDEAAEKVKKLKGAAEDGKIPNIDLSNSVEAIGEACSFVVKGPITEWLDANGKVIATTKTSQENLDAWGKKIGDLEPVTKASAQAMLGLADKTTSY